VHSNSGIANLAFYLLVKGGTHPRKKTSFMVPAIGYDDASHIFYMANVYCLTPSSTFYDARVCTADVLGGIHSEAVHSAWDAVGVPRHPPPGPSPLTIGIRVLNQNAQYWVVLRYTLQPVKGGQSLTCTTTCDNGDADLFLRWGAPAEVNPYSVKNECRSYSSDSNEACTTGPAPSSETVLHVAVHAYRSFSNLTLVCNARSDPTTAPTYAPTSEAPSIVPTISEAPTSPSGSNDDSRPPSAAPSVPPSSSMFPTSPSGSNDDISRRTLIQPPRRHLQETDEPLESSF
jgi:bacillolysin